MVETRLSLATEEQQILSYVDAQQNFLLSGGAGSGKTYSLVKIIRQLVAEKPTARIACMTYTNAAVREIEERVNHKNLEVTTIHDFLWDNIKHFRTELKSALIELLNDESVSRMTIDEPLPIPAGYFDRLEKGIQYKEYLKLKEGIISHDELLILAEHLFSKYTRINDILKDKYEFIFIDEYQDTSELVVKIFLEHFDKSNKSNVVGFFGDTMQSIYDNSVGNLDSYKGGEGSKVREIKKEQNRRNPQCIINLANKLRTDGLQQSPSADRNAPNMENGAVKSGEIYMLHSIDGDIEKAKGYLTTNHGWDFNNSKETKELNLTHNLIAEKAGFGKLMEVYDGDLILNFRDRIKKYIKDKALETDFSKNTFGEVLTLLQDGKSGRDLNSVRPTAGMQTFIDRNPGLYSVALSYNYADFCKVYVSKDQLLDDKRQYGEKESKKGSKRDSLIKHLYKIQTNIALYNGQQVNEFLRMTDYRHEVVSVQHKATLKENIESLSNVGDKTIEQVIAEANEKGICLIDDNLITFKRVSAYLYNRVKDLKFAEFQKLFEYLEGKTPFSTQHKTKGTEFNDVLVILNNGGWNNYNFENLFLRNGSPSVLARTQKIFYVCCTRAKSRLAVYYHNPSTEVIAKAKEWFGPANVMGL